jgi:hypothetical protein
LQTYSQEKDIPVVNDAFELLDPSNAQAYLRTFGPEVRRKGQACLAAGCLQGLAAEIPNKSFIAQVHQDGNICEVGVHYDEADGWVGNCSCDQQAKCLHISAVLQALMAEHSSAVVRNLSASRSTTGAGSGSKGKSGEEPGLARRLLAIAGRPLNVEETKFIRKVSAVFQRVRQLGHISRWDFQEMGFRLPGYGWDTLQIWPALPADEHEFWLYVVRAARGFGLEIPEFMLPVSDPDRIEERVAKWQRAA